MAQLPLPDNHGADHLWGKVGEGPDGRVSSLWGEAHPSIFSQHYNTPCDEPLLESHTEPAPSLGETKCYGPSFGSPGASVSFGMQPAMWRYESTAAVDPTWGRPWQYPTTGSFTQDDCEFEAEEGWHEESKDTGVNTRSSSPTQASQSYPQDLQQLSESVNDLLDTMKLESKEYMTFDEYMTKFNCL